MAHSRFQEPYFDKCSIPTHLKHLNISFKPKEHRAETKHRTRSYQQRSRSKNAEPLALLRYVLMLVSSVESGFPMFLVTLVGG